jgi:hypothetical protein
MGDDENGFVVGCQLADATGTSCLASPGTSERAFRVCTPGRFDELMSFMRLIRLNQQTREPYVRRARP